jgi:hypothetical protein
MAETADYDPGDWKGYDFKSARAHYDVHVGRSYTDAVSRKVDAGSLVPEAVKTESTSPLVICCDVTGSMGSWPATIFFKLPYLDLEGKEYLGDDMEICYCAVGDIFSDQYPLQVRPFTSGTAMKEELEKLVIEGNGGGQYMESYDIAAHFFAENCEMPKAVNPILIFIGDEGLYDFLDMDGAEKWCKVKPQHRMDVKQVFNALKKKFTVYLIRKPYGSGSTKNEMSGTDLKIQNQWEELLGADHVCILPTPDRVVDVIFGILARETNRIDYFRDELKDRQGKDKDGDKKIDIVLKSLHSIHDDALPAASLKKLPAPKDRNKSITRRSKKSEDDSKRGTSKPLV